MSIENKENPRDPEENPRDLEGGSERAKEELSEEISGKLERLRNELEQFRETEKYSEDEQFRRRIDSLESEINNIDTKEQFKEFLEDNIEDLESLENSTIEQIIETVRSSERELSRLQSEIEGVPEERIESLANERRETYAQEVSDTAKDLSRRFEWTRIWWIIEEIRKRAENNE